ncbi:hypothetical protein SISSUDRAFT_1088412 [Sistotremastrum suecicum HHB10207 ss-3]|uniref:Uncharacterized protein n=1 Tax=Sistotremastrum suecicum HHB10207 ss-3 TaxID=1314776 RepID=A0A165YVS2_9AGAM|nr:hypothetical protein SISSUDRAFT_1088412 [Sistotremastrum suecicum HHB10207 ss-3]
MSSILPLETNPSRPVRSLDQFNEFLGNIGLRAPVRVSIRLSGIGQISKPIFSREVRLDLASSPEFAFEIWCCPRKEFIRSRWGRPSRIQDNHANLYYCVNKSESEVNSSLSFHFDVASRESFNALRRWWRSMRPYFKQIPRLNGYGLPPTLLVGHATQTRSNPEIMHEILSRDEEGPVLPEEGEQAARRMEAVKYMECETGNADHLKAIIQEAMRVGWNHRQLDLTDTFIYRTERWCAMKWSSFLEALALSTSSLSECFERKSWVQP